MVEGDPEKAESGRGSLADPTTQVESVGDGGHHQWSKGTSSVLLPFCGGCAC